MVGNVGTITPNTLSDGLLGHPQRLYKPPIGFGFLHWVQIFSLYVLDQSKLQEFVIGNIPNHSRHPGKASQLGRSPAPLTGHDLVAGTQAPEKKWLNDAVLPDGLREFFEPLVVESGTRLQRIWVYKVQINIEELLIRRC